MYLFSLVSIFLCVMTLVNSCLPGQEELNGTCQKCNVNYFSKDGVKCVRCTDCFAGQRLLHDCAEDRDRYCVCQGGTYLRKSMCRKCTVCHPGYYVTHECGYNKDRTCKICPQGLTTNGTNDKTCIVYQPTKEPSPDKEPKKITINSVIIGTSASSIFFILIIFVCICFCYRRKRARNARRRRAALPTEEHMEEGDIELRLLPHDENENNHRKVRDLPANIFEDLGMKLNPVRINNWVQLAGFLGFDHDTIGILKLKPITATQDLLSDYSVRPDSTVFRLYNALINIQRSDAAALVEPFIYL